MNLQPYFHVLRQKLCSRLFHHRYEPLRTDTFTAEPGSILANKDIYEWDAFIEECRICHHGQALLTPHLV